MAQSVWARPRITPPPQPPPPPPPTIVSFAPVVPVAIGPPRATFIPHYDPSRIFKDIKVVSDMRQSGTERGEVQAGDGEMLGPIDSGGIAPPQIVKPVDAEKKPGLTGTQMALLAGAAFLIFGG